MKRLGPSPDLWTTHRRGTSQGSCARVGVEIAITRIEAKLNLSQNRPYVDVDGVIAGLRADGVEASADAVQRHRH
ncbi:hypothetical protein [Kribbella turkmenica]|uniref:hypothetical protein n=1 Tax=Kribbella turkmenica TaxID=2530375 RepID=UPI00192E2435|nr:hypothetical protein [Kribbella turkmenica]